MVRLPNLRSAAAAINLTTYEAGLIQQRAYRNLKKFMTRELSASNLSLGEWALLGQIYQNQDGLRLIDIAIILDVEAPLATNLVKSLEDKQLVERTPDPGDSRAKLVRLTQAGKTLVPTLEKRLRAIMRQFMTGVPVTDVAAYLRVLRVLAEKT